MFITELMPVLKELAQQPLAFMGGFCSGVFRLNLSDDPVRSWLDKQTGTTPVYPMDATHNGKTTGPQSIAIE